MANDWDQRYQAGDTPWDLRGITPPLQALADSGFFERIELPAGAEIAVPGCGRGHDLRLLAGLGYRVVGFDLAPTSVAEARRLLALNQVDAEVECRDVLGMLPEYADRFDLVYDYTCFCALPPYLRAAYGRTVPGLLREGGWLLTLAFPMGGPLARTTSPPYLVLEADLHTSFDAGLLLVDSFPAENSEAGRAGHERFYLWRRRV